MIKRHLCATALVASCCLVMYCRTFAAATSGVAWPQDVREDLGGFWRIFFEDGSSMGPLDFEGPHVVTFDSGTRTLVWSNDAAEVSVGIKYAMSSFMVSADIDLKGRVVAKKKTVKEFAFPFKLRFDPDDVSRFRAPHTRIDGFGYAFNGGYFKLLPQEVVPDWGWKPMGLKGWTRIAGTSVIMAGESDVSTSVTVTPEGEQVLDDVTRNKINGWRTCVGRVSRSQDEEVWLTSKYGPVFSGMRLGGAGRLWRFGTYGCPEGDELRRSVVEGCVRGVLRRLRGDRRKVGFVKPINAPFGYWAVSPENFGGRLREIVGAEGFDYVPLGTATEIEMAQRSGAFAAIINSQVEALVVANGTEKAYEDAVDGVRDYVRGGGEWLEIGGGATFYAARMPQRYFTRKIGYPTAFMDFQRLETKSGRSVTMYGVQPRPEHEVWRSKHHFVQAMLETGADETGGWFGHSFVGYVERGCTWTTPTVRIRMNVPLGQAIDDYALANDISRPMSDKASASTVEKFKTGLFGLWDVNSKAVLKALPELPSPSIVHIAATYLRGGMDHEYPDFLPPDPRFGTIAQFREMVDALHEKGHLFVPYTNPTWWGDFPRGPTFAAVGEAPLLTKTDGKHIRECWGADKQGWLVTFWHPAVRESNQRTLRDFTQVIPSDMLFQDQIGGRGMIVDVNPSAPDKTAYVEGLLSLVEESSRSIALGCEDGWDKVANNELAVFGFCFNMIPTSAKAERETFRLTKERIPADLWEYDPLALRLMHDKTFFYMHDLGQFVEDMRGVAWCVAFGVNLSCRWRSERLDWYRHVAGIQRDVMSRIVGRKLTAFRHDRSPLLSRNVDPRTRLDDGVVIADWNGVKVKANLGDVARAVDGEDLAPYGWIVRDGDKVFSSVDYSWTK